MICKVISAIERYNMPIFGKTVVIGVSGGADSMTLLDIMCKLQHKYSLKIIACHLNHCIRGEQADSDESFVAAYCKDNGIEFRSKSVDVPLLSKQNGMSEEEYGRKARYEFFNSIGDDIVIATAHTLSDRCETLLFNIVRGTSVKGLSSIPAVRGNIIRPLIDCTREEIEQYCADNNIRFVTDKTNFDDNYSRNRIRLNVIPQFKVINSSFETAAGRLINSAEIDNDYFKNIVSDIITRSKCDSGYNVNVFKSEHNAVKMRIIAEIIHREIGIFPEAVHINSVSEILNGGKVEIIGKNFVEIKDNLLRINPPAEQDFSQWSVDFSKLYAETPFGEMYGKIFNRTELSGSQFVHNKMIDFDKVIGNPVLRNRRAGDTIRLAGSSCTKKLKNLFNERKTADRNNIPILTDDTGVVWIYGIGCADRCKITDKTKNVLEIKRGIKND